MNHKNIIVGLSNATFSDCKNHRFALWRAWDMKKETVLFIGLNPSRANVYFNDPTITRCINFAKQWGYGSLFFGNLFSRISPDPNLIKNDLHLANHPRHDIYIETMMEIAATTVFCWGSWDFIQERKQQVESLSDTYAKLPIKCFGVNKDGNPKHPLYLKSDALLENFYHEKNLH